MEWPLMREPVSEDKIPFWNFYYAAACRWFRDPTIVWGTDVDTTGLDEYLRAANAHSTLLLTPAHILLRAVACAVAEHPHMNRRLFGRHVYDFKSINLLMPILKRKPVEVEVLLFEDVNHKTPLELARELWNHNTRAARGECLYGGQPPLYLRFPRRLLYRLIPLNIWMFNRLNLPVDQYNRRQRTACGVVNYLGFRDSPSLRSFKPSRLPNDACLLNVTMGRTELRPVVSSTGEIVARPIAPLFVRSDHRIADAHAIGLFVSTLQSFLAQPSLMDTPAHSADTLDAVAAPLPGPPTSASIAAAARRSAETASEAGR